MGASSMIDSALRWCVRCREAGKDVDAEATLWLRMRCQQHQDQQTKKFSTTTDPVSLSPDTPEMADDPSRWSLKPSTAAHCRDGTIGRGCTAHAMPSAQEVARCERALSITTTAVAAAVCRADTLPDWCLLGFPGRPPVGVAAGMAQQQWLSSRAGKRQKILVGLARVSGDNEFVGTVDEVLVLPELRRQGLGRRCTAVDWAA
jgi:ribosomal protein S18 acetylase RimI-like enzyme